VPSECRQYWKKIQNLNGNKRLLSEVKTVTGNEGDFSHESRNGNFNGYKNQIARKKEELEFLLSPPFAFGLARVLELCAEDCVQRRK